MFKNKIIITILGFYIFWLGLMPFIVTGMINLLCKNFTQNSNCTIVVENPRAKFSIIPVLTLNANSISIKEKNSIVEVNVLSPSLSIRLLPLLSGRVHLNSIDVDELSVVGNIDEEFELKAGLLSDWMNLKARCDSIVINKFDVRLCQKNVVDPISFVGDNLVLQFKNRFFKFTFDSELNVANKKSRLSVNLFLPKNNDFEKTTFDIDCTNFDLSSLKKYLNNYLPKEIDSIQGFLNINADNNGLIVKLINCSVLMKDSAKSLLFPKELVLKSRFNISQKSIKFENIDIISEKIKASISGMIQDYFGKTQPIVDLDVRLDKSDMTEIINMLPALNFEEINIYKLKKYKFYGHALANFSIKGRLPEPSVDGDIYIDNGILVKPIPNSSKGATIKLKFTGKHILFDVVVPTGGIQKVLVNGSQELYNMKYADMVIESSESVDLKTAQNILNPLHEILNFILGPVPIMDINGKGSINIIVRGNRKNPHIWGEFKMNDLCAWFKDLSGLKISRADVLLKFDDQNAMITSKNAILNGQYLDFSGTSNLLGKFSFDITSNDQPINNLYLAIKNSKFVAEFVEKIPQFDSVSGLIDFKIKVYGDVKHIEDLKFYKNLFIDGDFIFNNSNILFQNVKFDNLNGKINVHKFDADADLTAKIADLPMNILGNIRNNLANVEIDIPKLNPNFLISDLNVRSKQYLPYVSLKGKYKNGSIDKIDFDKLDLKATVLDSIPTSLIKYESGGNINITDNKIIIKNIKGYVKDINNAFKVNLITNNAFIGEPDSNGQLQIKTSDLTLYNDILSSELIPDKYQKFVQNYSFMKGSLDLNARVTNNVISANTDLSGIEFVYLPLGLPVEIINGNLSVRNNSLKLNKINFLADKMPVLIDGDIKDIFDRQNFNIYLNSKPQQEFIDKYINKNQIYPIKIKGDIVYWVKLRGVPKLFDLKAKVNMSKDSSIYHFGATVGDVENAIEVSFDSKVSEGNVHKIKEFSYDKIIDSQSGRQTKLNMLKAYGGIQIFPEDLGFNNLVIKTSHPTDARIFNIIFRKPNIKQGQFISDLKINGKLSDAKVLGDFHIFETNIPFLDTTMKNVELVFKDKFIEFRSKGEVIGNDIVFKGVLRNKLTPPYYLEKASLFTRDLDLNEIVNKLKLAEVDTVSTFESFEKFDINSIVAKDFKIKADNIKLRNIHATDFESTMAITEERDFSVDNFRFNIAKGSLSGKYTYNFANNNMGLNLVADSISANDITWALFDLNNQIYGDLTGDINITCNGKDFNHCMETLTGETEFKVKDGRMPKLGSLEYLLKAGNLVKGGFTGISLNSVIELITPTKTGEFSEIFGNVRIKDGIARNIEITTQGEDLSLYLSGTYNFATSIADMEVLGLLSRKMSTMFGPIGNMSINTLFNLIPGVDLTKDSPVLERINKIPAIELSSKAYRKFIAEIKGDIDSEDYVTSFKWIN